MKHDLRGKKILVLGLGKSGLGSARLLARHGAAVLASDDQTPKGELPYEFLSPEQAVTAEVDAVVISPGVPPEHKVAAAARLRGVPVVGEVEIACQYLQGPVLAITGSNGKTTTTSLTGEMLKEGRVAGQVGGNIGLAVSDMVESSQPLQWNVIEISSFQLESVERFHAQIAAVLNVTPNHLDRHGDFATYAAAKGRIFSNQQAADWAVLNQANETSRGYASKLVSRIAWFGGGEAAIVGERIELFGKALMRVDEVRLPGAHNLENVMAAAVVSSLAGAAHDAIARVAASFRGVAHRLEFVREWRGVKFYNDSKATSVDAAMKALAALSGPLWVVLGGKGKGASYRPLLPLLKEKAKSVLVIGEDAANIERDLGEEVRIAVVGDLARAIEKAAREATAGDTVLLAPACASYDQFRSYEERGSKFREVVEAL